MSADLASQAGQADAAGAQTQAFDDLAYRLLLACPAAGATPPALLLTSARDGEGKTTLAVAVAQSMARLTGEPVLLADANTYRPALQGLFALPDGPGLCDALRGELASLDSLRQRAHAGSAAVLTIGQRPDPALFLRPAAVVGFRALAAGFRCIVFDGASTRHGGASLAQHVDAVVVVVDSSSTRREVVAGSIDAMRLPPGRVVGTVLNKRVQHIPGFFYRGL